ncbi:MAG TPA: hypothetical protein VJ208_04130 [Candidatus Nanoarchaeia archaeon]|nr:hypothetical protein [Candidatus Nanoarchaeia archaeon]
MDKKGQHYHGHYTGDIPFGIWWLIVSVACIALGRLIPGLGVLLFIGIVLLILEIGFFVIAFIHDLNS